MLYMQLVGLEQQTNSPFMLGLFALRCVVSVGYIYLCRTKLIRFSGLASETTTVTNTSISEDTMQHILARLAKIDQLETALAQQYGVTQITQETPPALPVTSVTKQAVTQDASELAALLPAIPGVSPVEAKSVVDAYLVGIAKRDICSHLHWSSRKYGRIVKPVLDELQQQKGA